MTRFTVDFGAPAEPGKHCFLVHIPRAPRDAVEIMEDYGFERDERGRASTECRVILARELWTQLRDEARRDFNTRLKAKNLSTGSWSPGTVKLDRFLGRELCVLAWAGEWAAVNECSIIAQKWLALRPEERWWLYSKTVAEAGRSEQSEGGWRKALYCALSDATALNLQRKRVAKVKTKKAEETTPEQGWLFDGLIEKGDI